MPICSILIVMYLVSIPGYLLTFSLAYLFMYDDVIKSFNPVYVVPNDPFDRVMF